MTDMQNMNQTPSSATNKRSYGTFRAFKWIALLSAPTLVILRTLNLFIFFENDIGYYESGAILPTVFNCLAILIVLTVAVVSVAVFRKHSPMPLIYSVSAKCASVFVALGFAAYALLAILTPFSWLDNFAAMTVNKMSPVIYYSVTALNILAPLAACVYFVLYALGKLSRGAAFGLGIGALITMIITLALSYFNPYIQMNAPEKLAVHLGCICALLFILAEMRVMCGAARKALYHFTMMSCAALLPAMSLPTVIASFTGALHGSPAVPDPINYVFLAMGVFAIVRLIMLDTSKTKGV